MVRTFDICKDFHDTKKKETVHAVRDVSIEAHPGQIFGLLGANGAGKTTLLRLLSTVIEPTRGSAEVAGFDTQKQSRDVRRSIGFLSASTALYGRLNPRETLEYFGGLYGVRDKRRIDEVIKQLGIDAFEDRLCDKLSTGQKQRVSIARTILHDPPVLFFDEPTSGLDVLASQKVMEFVEEARKQNKTLFYCTHIMSEAERLCDKVAIIHGGQIRGEGSVEEIKARTGEVSLEKAFLSIIAPFVEEDKAA